ncbi:hypothetical protein TNCV_1758411 [Trichonephila clavipes]|nr:hypothetical protein TNCV_1758411 [Trichonephila clavipes]
MIMRYVKNPMNVRFAWMLSAKLQLLGTNFASASASLRERDWASELFAAIGTGKMVPHLDSSENFCEIIDIPLFSSVLKQHVLCVKCKKQGIDIKFGRQIQGLATELLIRWEFCGLIQPLLNTRFTNTVVNKKDTKMYEVNTRLASAMRSVGKGEAAAKVFCGVMNFCHLHQSGFTSLCMH